jgi:hypothetical protein
MAERRSMGSILDLVLAYKDAICVQVWIVKQWQHRETKSRWLELMAMDRPSDAMEREFQRINRVSSTLHDEAVDALSTASSYMGKMVVDTNNHDENERLEDALWAEMIARGVAVSDIVAPERFKRAVRENNALIYNI